MKKQSRTVPRRRQSESPAPRHLPLVDILVDTQAELQELVVASGLKVLEAMLEEDRTAVCGPRYAHQPQRQASRAGHTPSQVVLGGRKVAMRRPRARRDGTEVPLPTVRAFTDADPLNRRVVDQMLIGVATRQYARSLDPLGADVTTRGTSKSAVSRRFVAQTQAQLDAWRATPLDALDLAGLLIDGVHAVWQRCYVHFLRNALDYLPRKADDDCRQELRWLYDRRNLKEAQQDLHAWLTRWQQRYPKLTDWVEAHIGETLNFYSLPRQHHKHLKSTNMLERLNEEIKRRTRVVRIFPNPGRCCAVRKLTRNVPYPQTR